MTAEPLWISKQSALAIYEVLVSDHGGSSGVRDDGALEAALAAPRNHFCCAGPDLFILAAVYAHAVSRNHPFLDGNKRVTLTLAGVFLRINGFRLHVGEQEAIAATLALASRTVGYEGYAAWLRDNSKKTPRLRKPRR